ncbi:MFS transporter [Microbulbifer sp. THAF38]|uniref:MFS transporter n=1 Tax=Microbulbifer sp. THAF38 TaxID=2587856 RepID=UPI0012678D22|nr:MFS transporter [Microbulbifer sp. THAF38]QFT56262.1 Tetracycline resistance protein, class B [Microbulbifer sp. THAF38]
MIPVHAAPPLNVAKPAIPLQMRLTLLCLAALTIMSGATVAPSLPALEAHFVQHEDIALLSRLILSLPALMIALFAPLAGFVSDRYGRRRLLLLAVTVYALAGISALLQESLAGLLASRILLGIAVAGTMTSVTALVGDYFNPDQRRTYMSQQGAFISLGGVIFLVAGGLLADIHWRAPFVIYAAALLLIPAVIRYLPEPERNKIERSSDHSSDEQPDWMGFALLLAAALLNSLVFFLIPTQLPFLLKEIGVDAPSLAGIAIAASNLMGALASLVFYPLARNHLGKSGVFVLGFAVMACGMGLIAEADSFNAIMIATAIYGCGMGTLIPHIFASGLESATPNIRGRISGALAASVFIGQFLSPLISQPWIERFGLASSFSAASTVLLFLATLALLLHWLKAKPSSEIILQ